MDGTWNGCLELYNSYESLGMRGEQLLLLLKLLGTPEDMAWVCKNTSFNTFRLGASSVLEDFIESRCHFYYKHLVALAREEMESEKRGELEGVNPEDPFEVVF
jgi:hypothetical protein